jgi:predicted Zn-dependent protease with MMP-like domain
VDLDAFADLVTEALESLPEEFLEKIENVQVDIEEWPSPNDLLDAGLSARSKHSLLGLYHGVPMTERGIYYMAFPDRISIYQKPIEAMTGPDEERIGSRCGARSSTRSPTTTASRTSDWTSWAGVSGTACGPDRGESDDRWAVCAWPGGPTLASRRLLRRRLRG